MTNDSPAPRVGVVGASARAAVHSLARAGFTAWAVDLFGDRDLERVAAHALCPFERYPDDIPELASRFPPGPVLYTGGLENHPRVIAKLAADRELWGNPAEVVERVRDPHILSATLWGKGFPYPRLAGPGASCPQEGRWLRKPLLSSAGRGIRFALQNEAPSSTHYFQEFIDGPPMSVVFAIGQTKVTILGFTEQLIGAEWLNARPFQYAGNIGPVNLSRLIESNVYLLGFRLWKKLNLLGIVGVDFIPRDGEDAWVIEVNPRYPASVEVLELATGRAALVRDKGAPATSAAASGEHPATHVAGSPGVVGKAVYYAPHRISFPTSGPWDADLAGRFDPWRMPAFADIPHAGAVIEPGWPVLTLLASGSSTDEVRERLQSRAAELDRLLVDPSP